MGDQHGVTLSRSQQNIFHGVLQDGDPDLYLIGRSYRFAPIEVDSFLAALHATIAATPIQLCVLRAAEGHPTLVLGHGAADLIAIATESSRTTPGADLKGVWARGIFDVPLARYSVWTDDAGAKVVALDVHSHHILIDGVGTGIVEATLGGFLASGVGTGESGCLDDGFAALHRAHRREAGRVSAASEKLVDTVRRELAAEADDRRGYAQPSLDAPGLVGKGVLTESVVMSGDSYDALLELGEREHVPLNILVATAAVAVDAGTRRCTDCLLVHAVDNRFGDPDLEAATCLVNSVAHGIRFAPFASTAEVVRAVDRGYVKAVRRRWLREEQYRRMFLALNHTSHVEALTLNFLPEPCARELAAFLTEPPVTTDIGPVESLTVATVLDEVARTLTISVWNRAGATGGIGVAQRGADALTRMPAMWDEPLAGTVGHWLELCAAGELRDPIAPTEDPDPPARAWFLDTDADVTSWLAGRRYVAPWIDWLMRHDVRLGDVVVCADDDTDATLDLLVASHLAGCAYSVCAKADEVAARALAIGANSCARTLSVDVARIRAELDTEADTSGVADAHLRRVAMTAGLATSTAYVMPTSGSTGDPKLVPITHTALATFCRAARRAYGWDRHDVLLQCATLTSDISIEEVFVAASCGATVCRSSAVKQLDLQALCRDVAEHSATIVDLPTAIWHLLCDDRESLTALDATRLRQVVVGGEALRPGAVDTWCRSAPRISVVSTYGPTETTVVVTHLPVVEHGAAIPSDARTALGHPLVPHSVFVAFGEVVVLGDLVSPGYLGADSPTFGEVRLRGDIGCRAYATGDRVTVGDARRAVFAGRRDAVVKVAGRRVDTAYVQARIAELPEIRDLTVDVVDGRLGVWFVTRRTRDGGDDGQTTARVRGILSDARVPSFVVVGVPAIPRKANGKVDAGELRALSGCGDTARSDDEFAERATALARLWSRRLAHPLGPTSSLLDEGIGSLDLIRILPDTRTVLGDDVTILDVISADSASALLEGRGRGEWMSEQTGARIAKDLATLLARNPVHCGDTRTSPGGPVVILGASGVLGTGFGGAVAELAASGGLDSDVILVTRSPLPDAEPWSTLRDSPRIQLLESRFHDGGVAELLQDTGAGTVVNCIGNANMVVPYAELYASNVELVCSLVDTCAGMGAGLVHLSTYSITGDVTAPRVLDPRTAPYPYAASKALAELIIAGSPPSLNYTVVRLPRVLPGTAQLPDSADVLVSLVDACGDLGLRPAGTLFEEITTADAAARGILGLLPHELGRGISVLRGETVAYDELLSRVAPEELDPALWKKHVDASDWARRNPRRWAVLDGWMTLGERVGDRTYAEYLMRYPMLDLDVRSVIEVPTAPRGIVEVLGTLAL